MSDPTLGFNVDTSGLQKGNQALDKTLDKSKQVEQQANKTSDALGKMGNKSGDGLGKTAQSADQLAASLVKASGEAQKTLNVSQALDSIVAKTGVSYTAANTALNAAVSAHKSASQATTEHANSLGTLAGAAGGAIPPIVNLGEAAGAAGGGLGGLVSKASASSLGFGALAAAAAGAALAITKINDELFREKSNFEAITGSVNAGAAALANIKQAAQDAGVGYKSIGDAALQALQGVDKMNKGGALVIQIDGTKAKADLAGIVEMFATLSKAMETTGATSDEVKASLNTLAQGIKQSGGLTADTFQKIRDQSAPLARVIASAFGQTDIDKFQKSLERTPQKLYEVEQAIKTVKAAVDSGFDPSKPATMGQTVDRLGSAWDELVKRLGKTDSFDIVKNAIGGLTQSLHEGGTASSFLGDLFTSMTQTMKSDAQDIKFIIGILNWIASAASAAGSAISSAFKAAGGSVGGLEGSSMAAPQYGGAGFGGGGGGEQQPATTTAGNGFDFSQMSPDYASQVADGTYPAFATGGSFTVGGSGGTDSQFIQFMATPGEKVTIDPPGKSGDAGGAQTLGSLLPAAGGASPTAAADIASAGFANDIKTQTAALSDRINASTSSITAAVNASAANITAGIKSNSVGSTVSSASTPSNSIAPAAANSISSGGGGGGGGKLNSADGFDEFDPKQVAQRNAQRKQDEQAQTGQSNNPFGNTLAYGTGRTIKGGFKSDLPSSISGLNPLTGQPLAQGNQIQNGAKQGDLKQQTDTLKQAQDTGSKSIAEQVKSDSEASKSIGDKTNSSLSDLSKFSADQLKSLDTVDQSTQENTDATNSDTEATKSGFDDTQSGLGDVRDATQTGLGEVKDASAQTTQSVGQTTEAVDSGTNSIVSAIGSLGSMLANAISSAMSSASNSGASGFGSDISSGDSGSSSDNYDYASAVADGTYPAFANGGQFTVGGSGGTDSQLVKFNSSKGDVITVTPPGGTRPSNPVAGANPMTQSGSEPVNFWATPGEVVTVTPKGGTPPPAPVGGKNTTKGAIRAFADGGQMTLGDQFGAPSMSHDSSSLVAAHLAESMNGQNAALSAKISDMTNTLVQATTGSTSGIMSAIDRIASSLPASIASTSSAPTSGADQSAALAAHASITRAAISRATGGSASTAAPTSPRIPGFATGGQVTEGSGFEPGGNTSVDSLSSDLGHREQQQTATLSDKITASTNRIAQAITSNGAKVSSGISGLSDGISAAISAARSAASSASSSKAGTSAASQEIDPYVQSMINRYGIDSANPATLYMTTGIKSAAFLGNPQAAMLAGLTFNGGNGVMPGFATGGSFTVGGSGGTDTQVVQFKATPGERVTITPPGKASDNGPIAPLIPLHNDNIPGSGATPTLSMMPQTSSAVVGRVLPHGDPAGNPDRGARNVNIFVQQGVQADQFIRSRAEMQRAMR